MYDVKKIGTICKWYRERIEITQREVGEETGYSQRNISAFERGINDNGTILLWYLAHGLPVSDLVKGCKS